MVANSGLFFKKVPEGFPVIGEHISLETREFDLNTEPPEGGLTVKNLYLSFILISEDACATLTVPLGSPHLCQINR